MNHPWRWSQNPPVETATHSPEKSLNVIELKHLWCDILHLIDSVLGRNVITFQTKSDWEANFFTRTKWLAYSNLTSLHSSSCFSKNSINSTHQHITKYIIQQLQAQRSSLRWEEKKTWLTRAEKQLNKPKLIRDSIELQWLCNWWLADRLKPWFSSLN